MSITSLLCTNVSTDQKTCAINRNRYRILKELFAINIDKKNDFYLIANQL